MYETATWQSGKPRKSSPRPIASKHRGLESGLALENNQRIEGINQSPQAINLKLVEGHVMSSSKGLMVFLIFIIVLPDHCPPTSESKINHFNDIQQQERTATI